LFNLGVLPVVVGRTMLTAFKELRDEVADMKKMIFSIYTAVCSPEDLRGMEDEMPLLPLASNESLQKFVDQCSKEERKLAMVSTPLYR